MLTRSLEDYLEAILIEEEKGVVRVKDIVKRLGVKAPSVVGALKSLAAKGLVTHERYGYITLTKKGRKKAEEVYNKHRTLFAFFRDVLGVPDSIAEKDACSIEHYLSPETTKRFVSFIDFVNKCPEEEPRWIKAFKKFYEEGIFPGECEKERKSK